MQDLIRFSLVGALAFVALALMSDVGPPDNAVVVVDDERNTFASLPCAQGGRTVRRTMESDGTLHGYASMRRFSEVMAEKYQHRRSIDQVCLNGDGITQSVLQRIATGSRWREDGQWRW
jgi:hypothetical protein